MTWPSHRPEVAASLGGPSMPLAALAGLSLLAVGLAATPRMQERPAVSGLAATTAGSGPAAAGRPVTVATPLSCEP